MRRSVPAPAPAALWAVELEVGTEIRIPSGEPLDRDAFFEWLWDQSGDRGLLGIGEGAVEATEAAALGLVDSPRVLDVAEAPPDRDWVGGLRALLVTCWFVDEPSARDAARHLDGSRGCRVRGIRHQPWQDIDGWRSGFGPIDVPGFGAIRPAWDEGQAQATAGGTTLFIEPGIGFGTGLHETTQLCLAALAAWVREGGAIERTLDFGSGSGVLGIAAAVSGARTVHAVEIDPRVHDAIRGNAVRNGVSDRVEIAPGMPGESAPYDLVLANIVAPVLLEHGEALCRRVRRGSGTAGCLVLSGLLAEDLPAVTDFYAGNLGAPALHTTTREWHCLRFVTPV